MFKVYENVGDCIEYEYLEDVCLYENEPRCEKHIHEIEEICIERTKLYRVFIQACESFKKYEKEWIDIVESTIKNNVSEHFYNMLNRKPVDVNVKKLSREFDYVGHYFSNLAYSTKDAQLFLKCELDWLFLKATFTDMNNLLKFMKYKNLEYSLLSEQEKHVLKFSLISSYDLDILKFEGTNFYKVRFEHLEICITERNIFLKDGFGIIPGYYLVYFLLSSAQKLWREKINRCARFIQNYENIQLDTLLRNIPVLRNDAFLRDITISLENIEEHAKYYYPLCMQNIHKDLKKNNHLQHNSRMQYGIFLKHTGMPFEEAMEFWELEFTKKISAHEFKTKKYKYWFQHLYGKVGGRIDYQPQFCDEIIENRPSPNQSHGCPFAHFGEENLKKELLSNNLSNIQIKEIIEIKNKGLYKEACRKCCEFSNSRPIKTFSRPNEYYHNIKDIEDIFTD